MPNVYKVYNGPLDFRDYTLRGAVVTDMERDLIVGSPISNDSESSFPRIILDL